MKDEEWHDFQEYKNLVRCINDQGRRDGIGKLVPKPDKEISGTGLQSPEDPNATAVSDIPEIFSEVPQGDAH